MEVESWELLIVGAWDVLTDAFCMARASEDGIAFNVVGDQS